MRRHTSAPRWRGTIVTEIRDLIGDSGAEVVHTILRSANNPQQDAVSALVGLALSRSTADGRFW